MSEKGLNLLLIEDNDDDVFAFSRTLRKSNAVVSLQVASDGQQALDYLEGVGRFSDRDAFPIPSLIFLDLKLPYVSGLEILAWIRGRPQLEGLPVVVLTGSDEARDHEATSALGVTSFLVKPATVDQVKTALDGFPSPLKPTHESAAAV